MMHSHDRTLLSSLGFADPDKKDGRHDLACRYLCQSAIAAKLLTTMQAHLLRRRDKAWEPERKEWAKQGWTEALEKLENLLAEPVEIRLQWAKPEVHLCKGEGKYRTTIGFLDIVIFGQSSCISTTSESPYSSKPVSVNRCWSDVATLVEIKIGRVSISDALRQIRLYREYKPGYGQRWDCECLVTGYALSESEVGLLKDSGIYHYQLGAAFERFCQEQSSEVQMAASLEI